MAKQTFMSILKKKQLIIFFSLAGALGGFLYWKFVGCNSGTCPIKSVWYWSTLWGTAIGYLTGDLLSGVISKRQKKGRNDSEISEHN